MIALHHGCKVYSLAGRSRRVILLSGQRGMVFLPASTLQSIEIKFLSNLTFRRSKEPIHTTRQSQVYAGDPGMCLAMRDSLESFFILWQVSRITSVSDLK